MGPSQIEPLAVSSTVLHCDDFIMSCKWDFKTDPAEGRVCKKKHNSGCGLLGDQSVEFGRHRLFMIWREANMDVTDYTLLINNQGMRNRSNFE